MPTDPTPATKFNPHHAHDGRFDFSPDGAQPVNRRRGVSPGTPVQEARLSVATAEAQQAQRRVRELEPNWNPTPGMHSSDIEGQIRNQEARAAEATGRYNELTQGAIPGVNPAWGYQRLREELLNRGFEFRRPTESPGELFVNPSTSETVRIMRQPEQFRSYNQAEKYYGDYYYRYWSGQNLPLGSHVPIPSRRNH
jgi:hypothetical protein